MVWQGSLMSTAAARYHHGDLRRALLDSAGSILRETQKWDFSLREVARRAGVSHAAPYRHFKDKEALLAAVGIAGFDALRAHSGNAVAGALTPLEALRQLGAAYIDFGSQNPALYRLMFGRDLATEQSSPELREAMNGARVALRTILVAGAQARVFAINADDDNALLAAVVAAWSLVHGFTLLSIDQVLDREASGANLALLSQRVVERAIVGFV